MPATASGADAGAGAARSRDHNQGNQDRKATPEQIAAVTRIRRCQATAFYEILDIQKTVTDSEVKKAYRKQSLLTHPDKNGHQHADEAFKMVSRAFGVLGDKDKRSQYDRSGVDPDSRMGGGGAGPSGFGGARGFPGGGGGGFGGRGGFEEEMTAEEMFRRFFGGGGMGGGGGFPFGGDFGGPQFVFNMGGGPGIRVHQFGGGRPRTRPRAANGQAPANGQADNSTFSTLLGLLPILFLFVLPLLSSLFTSDSQPAMPGMVFDTPQGVYTMGRETRDSKNKYFVDPKEFAKGAYAENAAKLAQLDNYAEINLVRSLRSQCEREMHYRQRLVDDAQGWLFQDPVKMQLAQNYDMKSCRRLDSMNKHR